MTLHIEAEAIQMPEEVTGTNADISKELFNVHKNVQSLAVRTICCNPQLAGAKAVFQSATEDSLELFSGF